MAVLHMSSGELSRVETLMHVVSGRMSVTEAAKLMSVSRRHAHRLLTRYLEDGSSGLLSRRRGRPSNRRLDDGIRDQIVALVRTHYHDFGPTLAAEYLAERHDVRISREKLRQIMIEAGIWRDRVARRPRPYQPRYRRDCHERTYAVCKPGTAERQKSGLLADFSLSRAAAGEAGCVVDTALAVVAGNLRKGAERTGGHDLAFLIISKRLPLLARSPFPPNPVSA